MKTTLIYKEALISTYDISTQLRSYLTKHFELFKRRFLVLTLLVFPFLVIAKTLCSQWELDNDDYYTDSVITQCTSSGSNYILKPNQQPDDSNDSEKSINPVTYNWVSGTWSVCSVTCGQGIQTRTMNCRDGNGIVVSGSLCDPNTKPVETQPCNLSDTKTTADAGSSITTCPDGEILTLTARGLASACSNTVSIKALTIITSPTGVIGITCPSNIVTLTGSTSSATVIFNAPTVTGNIGGMNIKQTLGLPSGSTFPVGITTNTFTATDAANNTSSCSFTVTVRDNFPPSITCPPNVNVNTGSSTSASVVFGAPTATDNIGVTSLTGTYSSGSIFPVGTTTNTFTATDAANNTSSCSFTVTVRDNFPPSITCPPNVNVNTGSSTSASVVFGAPTATDNIGVTSLTGTYSSGSIFPVGTTTNTFTATDAANNTSSCSFTVTVRDNFPPSITCPPNVNVNTGSSTSASVVFGAPTATDNIGVTSLTGTYSSGSIFPVGTTTNTFTATDAANNTSSCSFTVTVRDNFPPSITCPANIVAFTGASTSSSVVFSAPTATDNIGVTSLTGTYSSGSAFTVGTYTNTFTAKDAAGNESSCSFTITVVDNTPPTVLTRNITANIDAGGLAEITPAQINNGSTDAYGIRSLSLDKTRFFCNNLGSNTVILTVTDVNGNTATGTATVTIVDQTPPTVITRNITANIDAGGVAVITPAQINNGSFDACGLQANMRLNKTSFFCGDIGQNTVILSVTDVNGNISTGTAIVTVVDQTSPTVITKNIAVSLDAIGNVTIADRDIDNGSFDACGLVLYKLSKTRFDCSNIGQNTVTLTITDINGNTATGTATVTVVDQTPPAVITKNIIANIDVGGLAEITAAQINNGSTDVCGIQSLSLDKTRFFCNNLGANTVRLTVTDVNGNIASATAIVTVEDKTAPVIITKNIAVSLDATGNVTIADRAVDNGSFDACGLVLYKLSKTRFNVSNIGQNTVTLTVTDINGNATSGTAVVTIIQTGALPVELINWSAIPFNTSIKNEWATASEKNSSHFEIERSKDGKIFDKMGIVSANGNSYSKQNYEFWDEQPFVGINYYRLKMVDIDSTFEYSKVVSAFMNKSEKVFTISPNPATDRVHFTLSKNEGIDAAIEVRDIIGRLIYQRKLNKEDNLIHIDWNTEGVGKGIYFATFVNGKDKLTQKIIIN